MNSGTRFTYTSAFRIGVNYSWAKVATAKTRRPRGLRVPRLAGGGEWNRAGSVNPVALLPRESLRREAPS